METDIIERLLVEPWRIEPHTFAEHMSGGKWKAWDYLAYIGARITEAVAAGSGRLIVNMPPGHGKSELLSHWAPTWFLDNLPHLRVIAASHSAELAASFGRMVRNEFEQNELLTTRLREDSTAADRWNTPQGGGMKTVGVGGGITGFRGDLLLIDDPHPSWEAVNSETHRKRVAEWFNGTLRDRAEPDATIVLLMHRWHEEDLVGQLLAQNAGEWTLIKFPAVAEADDLMNRQEGQPLCPQRFPVAALTAIKRAVGSLVWFGKYQQRPAPPEGGYFKRHWFEVVEPERAPKPEQLVRVWDLAATEKDENGNADPDWLAGCKMGKDASGDYWIFNILRDRLTPAAVELTIQQTAQVDGRGVAIRIEREGAASGKLIAHHYTRMMNGWDCRFVGVPRGSKFARSGAFNAACERKQVKMVAGPWVADFLDEAASFPNGGHDDQVDAAVGAYEALSGSEPWENADWSRVFTRTPLSNRPTPRELLLAKVQGNKTM
jgi:predicted phage terminase large subunit-like protein